MAKFVTYDAPPGVAGSNNTRDADPKDFGGQTAKALGDLGRSASKLGTQLAQAAAKKQSRVDTIQREMDFQSAYTVITDDAVRMMGEENIIDKTTMEQFGQRMQDTINKTVAEHNGGPDSRLRLTQRLAELQGRLARKIGGQIQVEQKKFLNTAVVGLFAQITAEAVASGDVAVGMAKVREVMEDKQGGFTPTETALHIQEGTRSVVEAVFDDQLENGTEDGVEVARKLLQIPGLVKTIGDASFISMRTKLITKDRAVEKGVQDGKDALAKFATIKGVDLKDITEEERAAINRFKPDDTPQHRLDLIEAAYAKANLPPLDNATKERVLLGFTKDLAVETLNEAGARRITTIIAPKILNESATKEDVIEFIAATAVINARMFTIDPSSRLPIVSPFRGEMTDTTRDALAKLGVDARGNPLEKGQPTSDTGDDDDAPRALLDIPPEGINPEDTAWNLAEHGTGLLSGIRAFGAHIPGFGDLPGMDAPRVIRAREQLNLMTNEMVSVLRYGNRADKERQEIKQETSISPELITTATAFRNRLIGIDNNMAIREAAAKATIAGGDKLPWREMDQQLKFLSRVKAFRLRLGTPPVFKSLKEAAEAKLPVGSQFRIGANIKLWNVKEGGG